MLKKFKYFLLVLSLVTSSAFYATHIVGGELYYDFIGGSSYKITLKLYRDCFNGQAPFDGQSGGSPALLHVFDASGNLVRQVDLLIPIVTNVPPSINNPCIQTPGGICVEEGKYQVTISLPPLAGGYKLVYQRCCRNNTILNLTNSGAQGASYQAFIPGPELALVNSSPRYNNFPQIFICNGLNITFDHKATLMVMFCFTHYVHHTTVWMHVAPLLLILHLDQTPVLLAFPLLLSVLALPWHLHTLL